MPAPLLAARRRGPPVCDQKIIMAINYAKNTKIGSAKTEADIRKMLKDFGAINILPLDGVVVGEKTYIGIMFDYGLRRVRMTVEVPDPESSKFRISPHGRNLRTSAQQQEFWLKEINRLWRALAFKVKARLISIEEKISDFEEEFFYDIVAPGAHNGETVGQILRPQLAQAYLTGKLPPLLPGVGETGG